MKRILLSALGPSMVALLMTSGSAPEANAAALGTTPARTNTVELAIDDGTSAGKRSIAGSGHGVKFEAQGKGHSLVAVKIYCSRYGYPSPPAENARLWVCDGQNKVISEFPVPYASFVRGEPKWVTIPIGPVTVPDRFVVFVGFNPTQTKGVYVHYDGASSGASLTGLPTGEPKPFQQGDWMIRAVVEGAPQPRRVPASQ